ncbi:MAG: acyltransferase family protein [Lachnospiraceae bacterium]|nr:acyltransferase family protein [Lachnospiraceae bacterium]
MDNKRLTYFDIAKGIAIILVLIGHLQGEILLYSPYIVYLCIWIFSFHMPFFFIVSGMLIKYKNDRDRDLNSLITRRFKGIMIPYYLFSIVYIFIVLYSLFITKVVPPSTLFVNIWYVIGLYGMNVLWFLPAMFLGEVLFLFIIKKCKSNSAVSVIIILTVAAYVINVYLQQLNYDTEFKNRVHELCITLLRPVFVCSFTAAGYYGYDIIDRTGKGMSEKKSRITVLIVSQLCLIVNIASIIVSMKLLHYNNIGDFRSLVQNNIIVYYIAGISGSAWLILISRLLSEKGKFKLLIFYGTNSLVFMGVHNNSAVLTLALKAAMFVNQFLTRARGYICYLIVILIMLIYTTIMILLINRFFPFMSGKKKVRTGIKA